MKIADLSSIDLTPGGGSKEVTIRNTTITYGINRDGKTGAIDLVTTPRAKRGEGSARAALTTFLKATDEAGITMFLTAEPRDKGITKGGLVDFYKSLGFKRNSGRARDFRSMNGMVRQPLKESQVDTPEFKRWFGGSKVVDENGAPLVVYHGTTAEFDAFSRTGANDGGLWGRGYYFAAAVDSANSYALRQGDGAKIIPAYVSIKNPLVLKTGSDLITRLPDGRNFRELLGRNLDGSKIRALAEAGGHDGVIQYRPNGLIGDIVAYSPTQIKSAIGNNGTFGSNNPNIIEGYNAFKGLSGEGIPDGFRLVKDDKSFAKYATVNDYHFVGNDGVGRLLHVVIGHPHDHNPDYPAHISFDVTDEKGNYQPTMYDHGRSGDVMQAVAHTIKTHIARFNPQTIQWIASGALQRMYRAILSKVAPGYTYSEDGSIGSITKLNESQMFGTPYENLPLSTKRDLLTWVGREAEHMNFFVQPLDVAAVEENWAETPERAVEYANLPTELPPILVRRSGNRLKIVDGNHRFEAAKLRGQDTFLGIVLP